MAPSGRLAKAARILLITYVVLFSSLIVHELGHYVAERYVVGECGVTNIVYSFDLLLMERHGLTYIACTDYRPAEPGFLVDLSRPTRPILEVTLGTTIRGEGHTSYGGLVVSALAGPFSEILFMTAVVVLLYKRYPEYHFLMLLYPLYLLIALIAAEYDMRYISPLTGHGFTAVYYGAYLVFTAAYVSHNRKHYNA